VTVEYKEALIFALLGVRRLRNEATALATVTGAKKDSVGGAVYLP
ncbi:MAG TPA: anhydro-N-acetylmuramic acid kinase, partial [Flavobacteriales bacterium]|nr:anhydro-N-acetylmuramic acid kinase [Flavobacteriales bacterium]